MVQAYIREITSKGGKARAESLTPSERKKIARAGGKALQASRTPEQRRATALKAARARWAKWREAKEQT